MKSKILIVEDSFLVADELADLVKNELGSTPVTTSTAKAALDLLPDTVKLAFLDIDVLDGTTFPVAKKLRQNEIPFIFVSGNDKATLPSEFQDQPFVGKPFLHGRLVRMAHSLLAG